MPIITLTSDMGTNNHYPAVLKGVILSAFPKATLVDITHEIPDYDIIQAAFAVKNSFFAFPAGTVHLLAVDPEETACPTGLVMKYREQFFIAPDNGVLSLICDGQVKEAVELGPQAPVREDFPRSFRAARYYAPAAAKLAQTGNVGALGPLKALRDLRWGEPSYNGACLRGKIIHIDKFGNAVTNIHRDNFMQVKETRRFEIFIRNLRLKRVVNTYSDVGKADALAIFGESHYLEIAMREASAADLLGLKVHDMITIEFNA
jgi:S-adenosyl-L-methionine hydrolase (adenosine-forming)